MKLKIGIMSNKELAEWFGISPSSLSHDKERKIKELSAYADFELIGKKTKKINIKKIYE